MDLKKHFPDWVMQNATEIQQLAEVFIWLSFRWVKNNPEKPSWVSHRFLYKNEANNSIKLVKVFQHKYQQLSGKTCLKIYFLLKPASTIFYFKNTYWITWRKIPLVYVFDETHSAGARARFQDYFWFAEHSFKRKAKRQRLHEPPHENTLRMY